MLEGMVNMPITQNNSLILPWTHKDGRTVWVEQKVNESYDDEGNLLLIEGVIRDITALKEAEDRFQYMNYHDGLTGLYNRNYCKNKIEEFDEKSFLPLSIIFIDINNLKSINDNYGHKKEIM